jgi:DNA polymerase-3 subunit alpha
MAAKSGPGFIHLRVHSAYSLLEGALPVKALAKLTLAGSAWALAEGRSGGEPASAYSSPP